MSKPFKILIPIALLIAAITVAVVLVASKKAPEQIIPKKQPPLVSTLSIQPHTVRLSVTSQGKVIARSRSQLSAEVAGEISQISTKLVKGGFFKPGEQLLQIDPADYQANVREAEAALASAQAQRFQEQARAEQAFQDWKTLGNKRQADPLVLRKPQLAQAEAAVKSAQAALDRANRKLAKTIIRAPWPAMVSLRMAELGQFVSPGTPLAELIAVDYAETRLALSDKELSWLTKIAPGSQQNGPEVILKSRFRGQSQQHIARIVRDEGTISDTTRMHYLIARIDDPYNLISQPTASDLNAAPLKIGSFVEATINGRQLDNVYRIPRYLLQTENKLHLLGDNNQLKIVQARLLQGQGEMVLIQIPLPAVNNSSTDNAPVSNQPITLVTSALLAASENLQLRIASTQSNEQPNEQRSQPLLEETATITSAVTTEMTANE
ncbi:efflux RND transporter periplasmic adaptor subunit [Pelagibaculum spongiae]|uniref:Membrane fusion protein biotin-lipoyl like domain-containing protein n=1 Tax=Pelagibaculum spongiae TaxID=2080658 RepID=A0A2V1GVK8_9GAMM|nr:efflux RND transporter periplasmic adaptor subunit [Pelagibaculum spongiae]PVZ63572.1 hypothetical protein DC094_21050 [Pelagibaculum spongiae]